MKKSQAKSQPVVVPAKATGHSDIDDPVINMDDISREWTGSWDL